jgi:hypothetical protein
VKAQVLKASNITLEVMVSNVAMLENTGRKASVSHLYYNICCLKVAIR